MINFLVANGNIKTEFGLFEVSVFYDGLMEATVLHTVGLLNKNSKINKDTHVKIQSSCLTSHYFSSLECTCRNDVVSFQKFISDKQGVLILLNQEGRGNGNVAHIASQSLKEKGLSQSQAYKELGYMEDRRDYSIVHKILIFLSVDSFVLHTGNARKIEQLKKLGLDFEVYSQ